MSTVGDTHSVHNGAGSTAGIPDAWDVLPVLERREDSIWAQSEARRDELFAVIEGICRDQGYDALLLKSNRSVQPAWVSIEAWIPKDDRDLTRRRRAVITIVANEFHRFRLLYNVELYDGTWKKAWPGIRELTEVHAEMITQFVLGAAPAPKFGAQQVRLNPYKFWLPRNKVDQLRPDLLEILTAALLPVGIGLLLVPVIKRRRTVVLSSGKPSAEPRNLIRIDSWQAMVSGLGDDAGELRKRFLALMSSPPITDCTHRVEQIWYWGLDGKVEREQIVMSLRRGIVFCHIYAYDDELYVGWDAHLNRGQWVEKAVARGRSKETGEYTQVNTVEAGLQVLNEYDLIDLSLLSEWVHAQLVKLVKRLMQERQIDQEIDFQIIRGDRGRIGEPVRGDAERQAAPGLRSAAREVGSRLRRTE